MAKFVFKLQSYFNLKEKMEDQKKLEYGQAVAAVEEQKRIKRLFEADRDACVASMRGEIRQRIDGEAIRRYNLYIDLLKKKIKLQTENIKKAEAFAEKKRLELVEAMKERKTLETLREKNYAEYLRDELRAEQKVTDEVVSYRFNNQGQGEAEAENTR